MELKKISQMIDISPQINLNPSLIKEKKIHVAFVDFSPCDHVNYFSLSNSPGQTTV